MINDFFFDTKRLSDFDFMIGSIDGSTDTTVEVSTMDYTEFKSPLSDVSHKVATSYPNNYTATIQVFKKMDCNNPSNNVMDDALTPDEISEITSWLCRKEYHKFYWIDDWEVGDDTPDIYDGIEDIFYNARFKVSKVIVNGVCLGLELTIETDKPFGYGIVGPWRYSPTIKNAIMTIPMEGDEEGYIYPDVIVTVNGITDPNGETFTITNQTLGNYKTSVQHCTNGEEITFYGGDVLQISSSVATHKLANDFNYKFPKLYMDYASVSSQTPFENTLVLSHPCYIRVSYNKIRKVGLGI